MASQFLPPPWFFLQCLLRYHNLVTSFIRHFFCKGGKSVSVKIPAVSLMWKHDENIVHGYMNYDYKFQKLSAKSKSMKEQKFRKPFDIQILAMYYNAQTKPKLHVKLVLKAEDVCFIVTFSMLYSVAQKNKLCPHMKPTKFSFQMLDVSFLTCYICPHSASLQKPVWWSTLA